MKKLLILAAVIVAGVAANAASFKWSAANIYDHTGASKYSGDVSLYAYLSTADASTAVVVSTVSASSGAVAATTFTDTTNFTSGNTYSFFFVVEDGAYTFTSAEKTGAASDVGTATLAFGNQQSATQSASNWAAVPEPTSGLLMLLGMAGLALRRRRA